MRVISLGWGVQSFGLAAMSALGVLPKVDAAIHADTTYEREGTYAFAQQWTPWLEDHGVRVITVQPSAFDRPAINRQGGVQLPAFTRSPKGRGQLMRQSTRNWKIRPIRRWLQANRGKQPVEMWLGITLDEISRVKPNDVQYIKNVWPFVGCAEPGAETPSLTDGLPWTRQMVVSWLEANGLEVPPKSSCYFCPYHSNAEWRSLTPTEMAKAVALDEDIRNRRPPYPLFLHAARIPLRLIDLRSSQEKGQMDFFDDECGGNCFL